MHHADRRSRQGVVKRVAAVAALADNGTSREAEALDALGDIVGHELHRKSHDECVSPLGAAAVSARGADHASTRLAIRVQAHYGIYQSHTRHAVCRSRLPPAALTA